MAKHETKSDQDQAAQNAAPGYVRKKLTAAYLDLAEMAKNKEVFIGTFLGKKTGPWIDKKTGQEKPLTRLIFDRRNPAALNESLGRVVIFEDAGLRKALEDSMVLAGETHEYLHLGLTPIGGGHTVNQYDIFGVESPLLPRKVAPAVAQAQAVATDVAA